MGEPLASGGSAILTWDMSPYVAPQSLHYRLSTATGPWAFPDFLQFASQFGQNRDEAGFDARFDLDGDGEVGFNDFVIFARSFGKGG